MKIELDLDREQLKALIRAVVLHREHLDDLDIHNKIFKYMRDDLRKDVLTYLEIEHTLKSYLHSETD